MIGMSGSIDLPFIRANGSIRTTLPYIPHNLPRFSPHLPPSLQNYEAETSALLFWQYLVCVFTIPPYLSFYLWIVGWANIAVATT